MKIKKCFVSSLFFVIGLFYLTLPSIVQAKPCGNGVCQASQNETCSSCTIDCGSCTPPSPSPTPAPSPTINPTPQPTTNPPSPTINPTPQPTNNPPPEPTSTPNPGGNSSNTNISNQDSSTNQTNVVQQTYFPLLELSNFPILTNNPIIFGQGSTFIESGSVNLVEYTFTNGAEWISTAVQNGFFSFTTNPLAQGNYFFQLRAKSDQNVYTQADKYVERFVTIAVTPPRISIDELEENPSKDASPNISGSITTYLTQLAKLEYSFDGGETWLTLQANTNFEFELPELTDGEYIIQIRATDTAGNQSTSDPLQLIIDTIPPTFGGMAITAGRQSLDNLAANIHTFPNTNLDFFVSFNGGVTQATLIAGQQTFNFIPKPGKRMWQTTVSDLKVGPYSLMVQALDGAGNQIEQALVNLTVDQPASITDAQTGKPITGATVTVYYFDPVYHQPVVWDAIAYGQANPQTLDQSEFGLLLPQGKYYLEFDHPDYRKLQTSIFEIKSSTLVTFPVVLNPNSRVTVPLVQNLLEKWWPNQLEISNSQFTADTTRPINFEVGEISDSFSFINVIDGSSITAADIEQQKLFVFAALWSSDSQELLAYLDKYLSDNPLYRDQVLVILPHETRSSAIAFLKRGKYQLPLYIDQAGTNTSGFDLRYVPQIMLINSDGTVAEISLGKQSLPSILEKLKE